MEWMTNYKPTTEPQTQCHNAWHHVCIKQLHHETMTQQCNAGWDNRTAHPMPQRTTNPRKWDKMPQRTMRRWNRNTMPQQTTRSWNCHNKQDVTWCRKRRRDNETVRACKTTSQQATRWQNGWHDGVTVNYTTKSHDWKWWNCRHDTTTDNETTQPWHNAAMAEWTTKQPTDNETIE